MSVYAANSLQRAFWSTILVKKVHSWALVSSIIRCHKSTTTISTAQQRAPAMLLRPLHGRRLPTIVFLVNDGIKCLKSHSSRRCDSQRLRIRRLKARTCRPFDMESFWSSHGRCRRTRPQPKAFEANLGLTTQRIDEGETSKREAFVTTRTYPSKPGNQASINRRTKVPLPSSHKLPILL